MHLPHVEAGFDKVGTQAGCSVIGISRSSLVLGSCLVLVLVSCFQTLRTDEHSAISLGAPPLLLEHKLCAFLETTFAEHVVYWLAHVFHDTGSVAIASK